MEQEILMKRIRNGEDEAFAELVNPLIEKGYRTSFSFLKSKEQAEEVVQNALIEAYRNIMSGKEITYFNTWFYKLVTHRSIDALRKNDRLKETPLEIDVLTDKHGVIESVLNEETENDIKVKDSDGTMLDALAQKHENASRVRQSKRPYRS